MKAKILLIMALCMQSFILKAQESFPGFRTGNYTGVTGVFFNPANIADSRYRWDFNLISASIFAGNDKGSFKLKDITSTNNGDLKNKFLSGSGLTNAALNIDVLGPSVMFNINPKSAVAITTRARVVTNIKDMDGTLVQSIISSSNNAYPYTFTSLSNSRIVANGWSEIGASYAREISNTGKHYFKGGVTIKYLSGVGNNYIQLNQFTTTINEDRLKNAYLTNTAGSASIGNAGANLDGFKGSDLFKKGQNGIGGDIGFVYEYRPDFASSITNEYNRELNKYKYKIGISILDVGKINYTTNPQTTGAYAVHISNTEQFYLNQLQNKKSDQIKQVLDANPQFFTSTGTTVPVSYSVSLPTVTLINFDYHLHRGFFVNAEGQINLSSTSNLYSAYQYNSITLTPRYEGKAFGIYLPINYNQLTNANIGIGLRGGPLFIGSGSLITSIFKSKQADVYFGLRFGILQKKKASNAPVPATAPVPVFTDTDGDGIADVNDKCPTIIGIAKYQGCPIPDSDSDGINDEVDKCPNVAGLARYQGCPIPDSDNDGVNDEVDKCPNVAGLARYQGCPIPDSDSDGINDEVDKCPTMAGPTTNFGCPVIKKEIVTRVNIAAKGLLFATGKSIILPKSYSRLNEVIAILKAEHSLNIDFVGYTDNVGKPEKNLILSEARANAAKQYFIKKGIQESRMTAKGYGENDPIAPNKTATGRTKNRRVEFRLRNY